MNAAPEQQTPQNTRPRRRRKTTLTVVLAALMLIGICVYFFNPSAKDSIARQRWKRRAVEQLQQQSSNPAAIAQEAALLNLGRLIDQPGNWVFDDGLLVMANGEWIVCRNICQKENWLVQDLFVGHGSDGRWYFSTFHFCKTLMVLDIEPQPASLADFLDGYALEPFDIVSEDWLKRDTWSGGVWGMERVRSIRESR